MKMPDNNSDKELAGFFLEMKGKDQQIQIPQFTLSKKRRIWSFIPYGIAASILLSVWFFSREHDDFKLDQDIVIITLNQDENQELKFIIETTTELEIWEPSTSSLLTEF